MYEDVVAETRRATEAAVRESQERVGLATRSAAEADRSAAEATRSFGDRWANRINAMRRRAAERGKPSSEMTFGHEDGPHPNDHAEADDLISLTDDTVPASAADTPTPAFGLPEEQLQPYQPPVASPPPANDWFTPQFEDDPPAAPPRRPPQRRPTPRVDDDEDYSSQSWLQDH